MDTRPENCRFRLQDEGKAYPRSSCTACGKTISTGLGRHCTVGDTRAEPLDAAKLELVAAELRGRIREWQDAHDLRPSEVAAILDGMVAYFSPTKPQTNN